MEEENVYFSANRYYIVNTSVGTATTGRTAERSEFEYR
jgi:hypothetical protein